MGICGVIAAVAMSLLTKSYRTADPNLVTVFEYTGMFWAPPFCFLGKYRVGPLLWVLA